MRNLILAATLAAAVIVGSAPLVSAHAESEGNGPSFPGLQVPDIGVSIGAGGSHVVATMDHTANPATVDAASSRLPQYGYATTAQQTRTLAMLQAVSTND